MPKKNAGIKSVSSERLGIMTPALPPGSARTFLLDGANPYCRFVGPDDETTYNFHPFLKAAAEKPPPTKPNTDNETLLKAHGKFNSMGVQ